MSDTTQPSKTAPSRPLSPHLQVYKLPMTALMSISHRISGVILSGGLVLICAFLIAVGLGPDAYVFVQSYAGHPYVTLFMFLWSMVLYFHLFSGVRHLIWDTVHLLDKEKAILSGWIVLVAAAGATALTWYVAAGLNG